MADVRLTDLEVIQRYSIAVRGETADREELLEAVRADLAWLEGGARRRSAAASEPSAKPAKPAKRPAAKAAATPAKRSAAKPAKKAAPAKRRSR